MPRSCSLFAPISTACFDNFMSFMIAAIDAILVSQNVALAAESQGLGICYIGSTLANCDQIGRILKLPHNVVPVVGFSLGYPDEDPALRDRLPLDGLVHYETYEDYTERLGPLYGFPRTAPINRRIGRGKSGPGLYHIEVHPGITPGFFKEPRRLSGRSGIHELIGLIRHPKHPYSKVFNDLQHLLSNVL